MSTTKFKTSVVKDVEMRLYLIFFWFFYCLINKRKGERALGAPSSVPPSKQACTKNGNLIIYHNSVQKASCESFSKSCRVSLWYGDDEGKIHDRAAGQHCIRPQKWN